ncbi:MAG TPA: methyltransferase domain-containing protein [Candidatus Thiothrix moscowensis]|uniref:class I SAM-dependent methyltransferase n=1 Tax=unclassified Thiothrix TaxID=2636184 RepID=UPI0025FBE726|nr:MULTISPECIES: methyltransferase domain-containing protein [unclassified Thiothrix]HRJ52969.1 methyltransferase domain-containing protein [Candidatus Thiothrix moscowensis]HRJ92987.1 methyltransferase domain-containing protein [Candidatus Thiothrix moscowensis]
MEKTQCASFEFALSWQSEVAHHHDRYFINSVDIGRNTLPDRIMPDLCQLDVGKSCTTSFAAGELVSPHDTNRIRTFPDRLFEGRQRLMSIEPRIGRFYPQGFASEALCCHKNNFTPFRLIGKAAGQLTGDLNHPLARYPLTLTAHYLEAKPIQTGSHSTITDMLLAKGSGLQVPYPGTRSDFYSSYPFIRMDNRADNQFYSNPRMVNHLDKTALAEVSRLYARLLYSGMKILDLMSSWTSHLPASLTDLHVTGLGMNQAELEANPRLQTRLVQNLNQQPQLPFADRQFDAVICTVSVEYLTQPLAVMREIARVTRLGGIVVMTFSDRWFPTKVVDIWTEMHPFERQGLVLDYFLRTGCFSHLHTESIQGLPRPKDDPHIREKNLSDPVFAVWGRVSG